MFRMNFAGPNPTMVFTDLVQSMVRTHLPTYLPTYLPTNDTDSVLTAITELSAR